jgi:hypothetical protein
MLKNSAAQIMLELLAYKSRQVATLALDLLHETRVMFSNNGIERGLFRSMPLVGRCDGDRGRSRHWT